MQESSEVTVSRINVYPMKSLDGVEVSRATVLPSGALEFDRRWAMIDGDGNFVNAKRTSRVHELASEFDLAARTIRVGQRGNCPSAEFSLDESRDDLSHWLSDFFRQNVRVIENADAGFPDDLQAPGPTVISTETLIEVARWFDAFSPDDARRRFRANIELSATIPFWEDRLFGPSHAPQNFEIGGIAFEGSNPCARCVVPSRDPSTGAVVPRFAADFAEQRRATLPAWSERSRFDHFYRLAVNTRLTPSERGGEIRIGDVVTLRAAAQPA